MSKLPIRNMQGKQVGEHELADQLLVYDKGVQALHDVVVAYQAHQRRGTSSTLGKGEVRGSGAKPWRQKGLGRARAGYRQSPVWRGGAVAFGPKPRKPRKRIPKKVGQLAFRRAFSERVAAGEVVVLDELQLDEIKTKQFAVIMKSLDANRGALFITDELDEQVVLSARNIPRVDVVTADQLHTYDLMRYAMVIVTKKGMAALEKRLGAGLSSRSAS